MKINHTYAIRCVCFWAIKLVWFVFLICFYIRNCDCVFRALILGFINGFIAKFHQKRSCVSSRDWIWGRDMAKMFPGNHSVQLSDMVVPALCNTVWYYMRLISCFTYMIGNLPSIPDLNLAPKFWCYCTSSLQLHAPSEMGNLGEDFGVQSQLSQKVFGALGLKNPKLPSGNLT